MVDDAQRLGQWPHDLWLLSALAASGLRARLMETLRQWKRQCVGRLAEPSASCADSQSVKTATQGKDVGFDGNKKIKGRKRHILVDTLGLVVAVMGPLPTLMIVKAW
jgi:putative transposase